MTANDAGRHGSTRDDRPHERTTVNSVTRDQFAAGLQELTDYFRELPELPVPDHGLIWFSLPGPDIAAFARLDQLEKALAAHDLPYEAGSNGGSRFVEIKAGPVTYRISRVPAPAWDITQVLEGLEAQAVTS